MAVLGMKLLPTRNGWRVYQSFACWAGQRVAVAAKGIEQIHIYTAFVSGGTPLRVSPIVTADRDSLLLKSCIIKVSYKVLQTLGLGSPLPPETQKLYLAFACKSDAGQSRA